MQEFKLFIDGRYVDATDGTTFLSLNPATGEAWARIAEAGVADVEKAVAAAQRALTDESWAQLNASQRGKLLHALADLISEHATELGDIETIDSGKLAKETRSQVHYVADYYRYYAGLADKIEGTVLPIDKPDMQVFTTIEPIGVVAAIVPWNAQMFLTATKLAPALAAGNTVVLKASEQAPAPLLSFARLIDQAGFPPGVVNVITGNAVDCGAPLTRHPGIARIAFTGGPAAARKVVENSAQNFAHTTLELGGKSPIIIFADANLEGAVNGVIAGNFGASGQSCVAGTRVFIQAEVYEEVTQELVTRAKAIVQGDPFAEDTQMGPLATQAQIACCQDTIARSVAQGAKILHGGGPPPGISGWHFSPTILACPNLEVASMQIEMFGPVVSVMPFSDEAEAVQLANQSEFGLASGVFTENLSTAHRMQAKLHSGIVYINTYRVISPIAPFGGFKQSGMGREAGMQAIRDYSRSKTVWINTGSQPMANPFVVR